MHDNVPRSLRDLTDDELLGRAFEPEFMHQRTRLEVELLWRLAGAAQVIEQAHAELRRLVAELLRENTEGTAGESRARVAQNVTPASPRKNKARRKAG